MFVRWIFDKFCWSVHRLWVIAGDYYDCHSPDHVARTAADRPRSWDRCSIEQTSYLLILLQHGSLEWALFLLGSCPDRAQEDSSLGRVEVVVILASVCWKGVIVAGIVLAGVIVAGIVLAGVIVAGVVLARVFVAGVVLTRTGCQAAPSRGGSGGRLHPARCRSRLLMKRRRRCGCSTSSTSFTFPFSRGRVSRLETRRRALVRYRSTATQTTHACFIASLEST